MATSKLPIKRMLAENLTTFPLCLHPFYDPLRSGRRSPPSANLCGPLTRNRLCQRFCHPGLLQSLPTARASLDLFTMLVPSHKLILFATHPSGQVPVPIYLHVPLHTSLCDRFAEYFSSVAPQSQEHGCPSRCVCPWLYLLYLACPMGSVNID